MPETNRPLKKIVLPYDKIEVFLLERLKHGESCAIDRVLTGTASVQGNTETRRGTATVSGEVAFSWQRKKFLTRVFKAKDKEGKELEIGDEFFDNLDEDDALFIQDEIQKLEKQQKKS